MNRTRQNKNSKKTIKSTNIILALLSILLGFVVIEMTIYFLGEEDIDGNFILFNDLPILPKVKPVSKLEQDIRLYLESKQAPSSYDPDLGWAPAFSSRNDMNEAGIRSDRQYTLQPPDHVYRIALFGDSFTLSAEVDYQHSWGFVTEQLLNQNLPPNVRVEVLNFGENDYGMDQAFLRWKKTGYKYHPHLVIFGFQPENVSRNVNLIPALYSPATDVPFSKPRFILDQQQNLQLINSPTIAPQNLSSTIADFENWKWAQHEYHFYPEDYVSQPWLHLKTVSLLMALWRSHQREEIIFDIDKTPAQISIKIIQKFKEDVEKAGADFLMVHLPNKQHLTEMLSNQLPYPSLLEEIKTIAPVIHPEEKLLTTARRKELEAVVANHYTEEGYRIVGEVVSESVQKFLVNKRKTQNLN